MLFSTLQTQIEQPFLATVGQLSTALTDYVRVPGYWALVLFLIGVGILIWSGKAPVSNAVSLTIRFCVVAWFILTAGPYTEWVQTLFLSVLPTELANAVTGSFGTMNANSFDAMWDKAYDAGLKVWRLLGYFDVGEMAVVGAYWLLSYLACIAMFFVWMMSHVLLGLLVILGPLVIPMALFGATRPIFERWVGALIGMVLLQLSTVIMLTMVLLVETQIMQQLFDTQSSNQYEQIRILFAAMGLLIVSAALAWQLPHLASGLASGLHFHTASVARSLSTASRGALRAGGATANRISNDVRDRIRPPQEAQPIRRRRSDP